jgi:hypothetical protein
MNTINNIRDGFCSDPRSSIMMELYAMSMLF